MKNRREKKSAACLPRSFYATRAFWSRGFAGDREVPVCAGPVFDALVAMVAVVFLFDRPLAFELHWRWTCVENGWESVVRLRFSFPVRGRREKNMKKKRSVYFPREIIETSRAVVAAWRCNKVEAGGGELC